MERVIKMLLHHCCQRLGVRGNKEESQNPANWHTLRQEHLLSKEKVGKELTERHEKKNPISVPPRGSKSTVTY